jgi:hypothetical protein
MKLGPMQFLHPQSNDLRRRAPLSAFIAVYVALLAAHGVVAGADPEAVRSARLKALAADQANVRQTIAALRPDDTALDSLAKATAAPDKPLLDAALAARQKAVEAGNAYLARLVPETDPVEIELQGDQWIRVQNALELANLALTFANERNRLAIARGAEREASATKMPDLVKRDNERLAARKSLLEANLQLRIAERKRRAAEREFEETLHKP